MKSTLFFARLASAFCSSLTRHFITRTLKCKTVNFKALNDGGGCKNPNVSLYFLSDKNKSPLGNASAF